MLNKDAQIALLRALQDTNSTFVEGPDYDN